MSTSSWVRRGLDISKLPRVKLDNIQDLPGAKKKAIRIGRGPGSRRGKTCGRGHKGQGQRNKGAKRIGFEGGQTPFYLSVPKHGFKNKFKIDYEALNLSRLQFMIDTRRLDPSKPIRMDALQWSGAVRRIKHGVKLLGDGAEWFKTKVDIEVSRASVKAIEAVERQGGTITTAHYNKLALRVLLKPWRFQEGLIPRRALPNKKLLPYYMDPEKRGYLAMTEEGKARLKEGGLEGAYLGQDGHVHIPGRKVTRYSEPSPTKEEYEKHYKVESDSIPDELGTPV